MWVLIVVGVMAAVVIAYNYGRGKRLSDEFDHLQQMKAVPDVFHTEWLRKGDGSASVWMAFVENEEGAAEMQVLTVVGKSILKAVLMSRKEAHSAYMNLLSSGWRRATSEAASEGMDVAELAPAGAD